MHIDMQLLMKPDICFDFHRNPGPLCGSEKDFIIISYRVDYIKIFIFHVPRDSERNYIQGKYFLKEIFVEKDFPCILAVGLLIK